MHRKRLGLLLAVCCFAQVCFAQNAATATAVVPITKEPSHHLVFENEYVRVFKVEVAPHAETLYHKHDVDYVFVTLGDSDVESVRLGEPPVRLQLKDGETRFTKGGFAHKAVNRSDKPFVNVTVELKKDSNDEMKNCIEPMECKRELLYHGRLIGDTLSLFSNGSLSATYYHLLPETSFIKSRFCTDVQCRWLVLFIPLDDLDAQFDGKKTSLKTGQAYFTSVDGDVGASAGTHDIRWIVINLGEKLGPSK
jgi:quercetin dioxygenase-like cupin family protein